MLAAEIAAGHRPARLDDRGRFGARGLPPAARSAGDRGGADHHAHRAQRGGGPGQGARDRRRRLCHQAVQPARADRPGEGGAAPRRGRCWRTSSCAFADLEMDLVQHKVRRGGRSIALGPTEFRLLRHFLENPARVFSRERLLDAVWGRDRDIEPRTVDVHIRRLRQAINVEGRPELIRTVRRPAMRSTTMPAERRSSPLIVGGGAAIAALLLLLICSSAAAEPIRPPCRSSPPPQPAAPPAAPVAAAAPPAAPRRVAAGPPPLRRRRRRRDHRPARRRPAAGPDRPRGPAGPHARFGRRRSCDASLVGRRPIGSASTASPPARPRPPPRRAGRRASRRRCATRRCVTGSAWRRDRRRPGDRLMSSAPAPTCRRSSGRDFAPAT